MEDWWIHDRLRILIIVTCKILALVVIECYDQSCVRVLGSAVGKIVVGLDDRCVEGDRMHLHSSPEFALLKGLQVKAGDNAKIVSTTTKGKIQIGVRVDIDVCDFAICENDLIAVSYVR